MQTRWKRFWPICGIMLVILLMHSAAFADNAFLSTARILVNGVSQKYVPGPWLRNAAVTKTVFDITISYHDTLSADSVPAGDPKRTRAQEVENVIGYWSDALFEQSNGQHMLGTVYIYQGGNFADKASVIWKASTWPTGAVGGYGKPGQQINFGDRFNSNIFVGAASTATSQANGGYTLAHESGHFVYALYDEYVATYANPPVTWPWSSDVSPNGQSIMNYQWGAMKSADVKWLNHSTQGIYTASTDTAQKRVYGKSCWEVLLQDPSLDGAGTGVIPGRIQYAFGTTPTSPDWYVTAITPGTAHAPARANLKIVWLAQAAMAYQIIIDHSGSMVPDPSVTPSPLDNAKAAASSLVESLPKESAVGVVMFDDSVSQIYALTFIPSDDAGARAVKDAAKAAIAGISAGGMTAIYDAASTALDNIKIYQGAASQDTLGVSYLLTDGQDNSSSKTMAQVIAEYQAAKVPLITVGYGSGGAAGSAALTQLADGTGGQYFESPTTQAELQQVFFAAQGNYSDVANLGSGTKNIAAGLADTATFRADSTLGSIKFFVNWQGTSTDVTITVKDPSNAAVGVTPVITENGGMSDYAAEVDAPAAGLWTLEMRNNTAAALDVSYAATGLPTGGTGFSVVVGLADGGSTVTAPNPVKLLARVSKRGVALSGATLQATLTPPSGTASAFTFYDDGTNGDVTANDGIYSALITSYSTGTYKVDVTASNPAGTAKETYRQGSPSQPGPGDEAAVFSEYGATIAENFLRSTTFQFKTSGGATPTPTPTTGPTVTPTATPTITLTPTPTGGGGGGGGGGCNAGFPAILTLLLLAPAALLLKK